MAMNWSTPELRWCCASGATDAPVTLRGSRVVCSLGGSVLSVSDDEASGAGEFGSIPRVYAVTSLE